jgi:hypothetical protein
VKQFVRVIVEGRGCAACDAFVARHGARHVSRGAAFRRALASRRTEEGTRSRPKLELVLPDDTATTDVDLWHAAADLPIDTRASAGDNAISCTGAGT